MNIPATRAPMTLQQAPSLILDGNEATVPTPPQSVSLAAVASSAASNEAFMPETAVAPVAAKTAAPTTAAIVAAKPDAVATPSPAGHALTTSVPVPSPGPSLGMQAASTGLGGSAAMLGAMLLIVGLILGLGKLVQKLQAARAARGGPALNVKGGLALGNRERLLWVQAGETHLLLGVSPGSVQTLHVFDRPPQAESVAAAVASAQLETPADVPAQDGAATTPASRDFANRLQSLLEAARARTAGSAPAAAAPVMSPSAEKAAVSEPALFSFQA